MEHLWAPWRNRYVTKDQPKLADSGDLFADLPALGDDKAALIIHRSETCYAILNRYPYNSGHLMVIPFRAVDDLDKLETEEMADLWATVTRMEKAMKKAFNPHGFNIGINIGSCAGAGIPQHLHVHVVPRWKDDANFLTSTAETRIHPADLDTVYQKMVEAIG